MVIADNGHHSIIRNSSFFKAVVLQEVEDLPLHDMTTDDDIRFETGHSDSHYGEHKVNHLKIKSCKAHLSQPISSIQRDCRSSNHAHRPWTRSHPLHHHHVCWFTARQMIIHTL
ncbi:hypothetical protein PoB_005341000 [Plakobranchus ocellatus]|uniref:Uncharacterized protein n=1 Tax=Plakobranchus ocellatus TaxID=259542 RepID=A0AAV4C2K6_9GAST|nr:hypothetical protein PoB_005341000 [Plakobranchus ocellatus]